MSTSTGPVVSVAAATRIRNQVADAVAAGAKLEIPEGTFPLDIYGTAFVGPQVLTNVNHTMGMSIVG
jgi:acyl-CoA reductase-like NAD-dependent aldehyde dehydrogenase